RLKSRGKSGRFGVIHEIIPTFEYILRSYKAMVEGLTNINYNEPDVLEDY
ncbi:hypothetical protein K469DRAFT_547767, partial [Zopfia rhizophila CBS 207.26]